MFFDSLEQKLKYVQNKNSLRPESASLSKEVKQALQRKGARKGVAMELQNKTKRSIGKTLL